MMGGGEKQRFDGEKKLEVLKRRKDWRKISNQSNNSKNSHSFSLLEHPEDRLTVTLWVVPEKGS